MEGVVKGPAEVGDDTSMTESTVELISVDNADDKVDDKLFPVAPKIKLTNIGMTRLAMPQQKARIPEASGASVPGKRS